MPDDCPIALVVDDDPMILMQACDILEDAGFTYKDAEHGDAAKLLLCEIGNEVTLLFTDVEMPGETNGFALARHTAEHWPEIEIVVASGRQSPQDGDLPAKATFIAKPFSSDLVHSHLREKLPDGKKPQPLKASTS